jgi:hypothetical protein
MRAHGARRRIGLCISVNAYPAEVVTETSLHLPPGRCVKRLPSSTQDVRDDRRDDHAAVIARGAACAARPLALHPLGRARLAFTRDA